MKLLTTFTLGLLAKTLSMVALQVSTWIMEKRADGQGCHHFCQECKLFWRRLVISMAGQLSGYGSRSRQRGEYDEWQSEAANGWRLGSAAP